MSIRIIIVDDHAVVRAGMRLLIESDPSIEIVGEGENGKEAVELAKKYGDIRVAESSYKCSLIE